MARLPRIGPVGIAQHIIQRGNNRQICFGSEQDFAFYANCLKDYSEKYRVDIHAWVFMTNHVHLLATPLSDGAVSKMVQAIGRHYVRYFNKTYRRSGTLWEGRFKSCLVQSDLYALTCQRYIELNPVRAGMVSDPSGYIWSSYQCSALGKVSDLFKPHDQYLGLGDDLISRLENYRSLFRGHFDKAVVADIRDSVNKGLALGSHRFKSELAQLHNRRLLSGKAGRPKKEKLCSYPD